VPPKAAKYASFLFSFIGRGVCKYCCKIGGQFLTVVYIFIGTILLHDHVLRIIAGSIIAVVGVLYIVLEFIPSIEPPENMRLGDGIDDYENATETL
jgi:hypothetical protein